MHFHNVSLSNFFSEGEKRVSIGAIALLFGIMFIFLLMILTSNIVHIVGDSLVGFLISLGIVLALYVFFLKWLHKKLESSWREKTWM